MAGLGGSDGVELTASGIPGFERRNLNLESSAPGEVGHSGIRIDAEDPAASRLELSGGDSGATADVKGLGSGDHGDDLRYQSVGISGASPVVALGVRPKRLGYFSGSLKLTRRVRCSIFRHNPIWH